MHGASEEPMPRLRLKRQRLQAPEEDADPEPSISRSTAEWAAEAVAQARSQLAARLPGTSSLEAAALLTTILIRLPQLWPELAQDVLTAFGECATVNSAGELRAGGPAFVAGQQDATARTRRLLLAAVASASSNPAACAGVAAPADSSATLARVALLCALGEAEADEGRFIQAFKTLRRAQALSRRAGHPQGEDQAEAALEGLRAASLQRWHFQMLNDTPRSETYGAAIAAAAKKLATRAEVQQAGGIVALDIGTGTGLLAMMCARLPAVRAIHACEMNEALCAVAREVIQSCGRESRCPIEVHGCVSTELKLPERVDLVFSEVFDAGLLGEHALPTIFHAREHLLKPSGVVVPARARIFGQLIEAPELLGRFGVAPLAPGGLNLSCVRLRASERYTCETLAVVPHRPLTEPRELLLLDFSAASCEYLKANMGTWLDPPLQFTATATGSVHALAYWWELDLDEAGECRIGTSPNGGCESWQQAIRPLAEPVVNAEPLTVKEGGSLALHLRLQADGIDVFVEKDAHGQRVVTEAAPEPDVPELRLTEEELLLLNDVSHWDCIASHLDKALRDLGPGAVQVIDMSESPVPLASLLAARLCGRETPVLERAWVAVRGGAEREALAAILRANLVELDPDKISLLTNSTAQLLQTALPCPTLAQALPAALFVCEDVVEASGALRTGVLEDLALIWRRCAGASGTSPRRVKVVPEALHVDLVLINSVELQKRTRVLATPGGINVSTVNALSIQTFLGLEEALLQPTLLSEPVRALTLPLGSEELLSKLAELSQGSSPLVVRLVAKRAGVVHGIVTQFHWPRTGGEGGGGGSAHSWNRRLAGVLWPCDGGGEPPLLQVGDSILVAIRYTAARGLVFSVARIERRRRT